MLRKPVYLSSSCYYWNYDELDIIQISMTGHNLNLQRSTYRVADEAMLVQDVKVFVKDRIWVLLRRSRW